MAITPMMQQYLDAKARCGDAILLFRMGDFYELFFEDAKIAAQAVGLTLTSRDKGADPTPMAGFPFHQLDGYLAKLIHQGFRVAVCEQIEDPKKAQGIVKRDVTRIVTPGALTDDSLLEPQSSNYLAAIALPTRKKDTAKGSKTSPDTFGIAWADLSTGRFFAATLEKRSITDEIARVAPSELLISEEDEFSAPSGVLLTKRPKWAFGYESAFSLLTKQFSVASLEGFGFESGDSLAIRAAGAVFDYLQETQKASLDHFESLTAYRVGQVVEIDEATRRSLELLRTMRGASREGSLLASIDRCVTPMGSRLLADWLASPLGVRNEIEKRHDAVEEFATVGAFRQSVREALKNVYDLERLLARVATGRATPRDLRFVANTLAKLPEIKASLAERKSQLIRELEGELDLCPDIRSKLEQALEDECPLSTRDGGIIRSGYHSELDHLRELAKGGKQWIAEYQAKEIERTQIPNLKVGFNKVFGYYLEVTNSQREKVPPEYIRKQTIKNGERFMTPELKSYEEQVLTADERSKELESEIFVELREMAHGEARRLHRVAIVLANLDVVSGLAELAKLRGYCRPRIVDEPSLHIVEGRHPVLDALSPEGTFVPNDISLSEDDGMLALITGPNMAGKSTYIRQVALITILAHMGSFVPAKEARVGIVDRVFARVGASDDLARGQSTFMVEMTETARILNTATPRSLVILDEIGRGTSTYDGVSLAWAIAEHLHDVIGCRALFATHYHELTDLASTLKNVRNWNVAVREWEESLVFLHKIVPGPADKSYGIHVARLAGVPREVNERAKSVLNHLESDRLDREGKPKITIDRRAPKREIQLTLFAPEHPVMNEIRELELNKLTPMEALLLLQKWQSEITTEPNSRK